MFVNPAASGFERDCGAGGGTGATGGETDGPKETGPPQIELAGAMLGSAIESPPAFVELGPYPNPLIVFGPTAPPNTMSTGVIGVVGAGCGPNAVAIGPVGPPNHVEGRSGTGIGIVWPRNGGVVGTVGGGV